MNSTLSELLRSLFLQLLCLKTSVFPGLLYIAAAES